MSVYDTFTLLCSARDNTLYLTQFHTAFNITTTAECANITQQQCSSECMILPLFDILDLKQNICIESHQLIRQPNDVYVPFHKYTTEFHHYVMLPSMSTYTQGGIINVEVLELVQYRTNIQATISQPKDTIYKQLILRTNNMPFCLFGIHRTYTNTVSFDIEDTIFMKSMSSNKYKRWYLQAIIEHTGSATSGHYTASILSSTGIWYKANDNQITKLTISPTHNNMSVVTCLYAIRPHLCRVPLGIQNTTGVYCYRNAALQLFFCIIDIMQATKFNQNTVKKI